MHHLNRKQAKEFELYADAIIDALNQNSFGCDIRIKSYLSLLLLLANVSVPSPVSFPADISSGLIRNAIMYINENLTNDISVQTIANSLSISRSRLSHLFKDYMGISLWSYIIARRIQYAEILLKQGISVTDTCYECGFKDYSHFVKMFSKINGISPGKYGKHNAALSVRNKHFKR